MIRMMPVSWSGEIPTPCNGSICFLTWQVSPFSSPPVCLEFRAAFWNILLGMVGNRVLFIAHRREAYTGYTGPCLDTWYGIVILYLHGWVKWIKALFWLLGQKSVELTGIYCFRVRNSPDIRPGLETSFIRYVNSIGFRPPVVSWLRHLILYVLTIS